MKKVLVWIVAAFAVCISVAIPTAGSGFPRSADCGLTALNTPVPGQSVQLELSIKPLDSCSNMTVFVQRQVNAVFKGDTSWTLALTPGETHSEILTVTLADTGLSGIDLVISCGQMLNFASAYFWPDGDTVFSFAGRPAQRDLVQFRGRRATKPARMEDTLSEEIWQTECELFMSPLDSADQAEIEKIIGRKLLPEDKIPDGRYRIKLTLRTIAKLGNAGFERAMQLIEPPPVIRAKAQGDD